METNNKQASLMKFQKRVETRLDLARAIIQVMLCFNNIKLSDTEVSILSYFMVYGINSNTKELIVKSQVCKNIANVKTIMVKLKKLGLIYKDEFNGKVYIVESLHFDLTPTVGIYLKIENKA
jgi:hypothetical protein